MAVRQYIGARYVPKFYEAEDHSANWQAGVIYEPLTIVMYNGNSYTSKKEVPSTIGEPSANPEYWVATGIYSAQVAQAIEIANEALIEAKKKKLTLYQPGPYPYQVTGDPSDSSVEYMQGGCCLPDGRFLFYMTDANDANGKIELYDSDGTHINTTPAEIGHGNDFCYSARDGRIYATGLLGTEIEVFSIVGNTITLVDTIQLTSGNRTQGIVEVNGRFYTYNMDTNSLYVTDDFTDFELIKDNFVIPTTENERYYHQGIAYDGDYLYWVGMQESQGISCILAYDLEGNYLDSVSFPTGWGECEWVDFYGGLMYSGFGDRSVDMACVRRDPYRNYEDKYPYPQAMAGGKESPVYVYLDSSVTSKFTTGRSDTDPFKYSALLAKCISGSNHMAIRMNPTNTELVLSDITGSVRGAATLTKLEIRRCNLNLYDPLTCTNQAIIQRSNICGDISADINLSRSMIAGSVAGTVSGNNNVITGTITGSNNITP